MSLKFWKSGAYKTVTATNVAHIWKGGAWKIVTRMRVWKTISGNSGWRDFYVKSGTTPPANPPPAPPPPVPDPVVLSVILTPNPAAGQRQATMASAVTTPIV